VITGKPALMWRKASPGLQRKAQGGAMTRQPWA
jgi:hypothetical protein